MSVVESGRGVVNTWECDENAHMNVQFYWAKFADADAHFLAMTGLGPNLIGPRRTRHVRYHKELRAGTGLVFTSFCAPDGPHPFAVVHEMREAETGVVAATALDGYYPPPATIQALASKEAKYGGPTSDLAKPRAFAAPPSTLDVKEAALFARGAAVTYRGRVLPSDCEADGGMGDRGYVARVTDAASHAWDLAGLTRALLDRSGAGRVAVEMKLTRGAPLVAGDLVHIVTGFLSVERTTFAMRHHLFETRSGRPAAVVDVVALILDLGTRRSMPLPEIARARIAERRLDP